MTTIDDILREEKLSPRAANFIKELASAIAMVRHMVDGLPATNSRATLTAALVEARGALERVIKEADRDTLGFRRARTALATIKASLGRVE